MVKGQGLDRETKSVLERLVPGFHAFDRIPKLIRDPKEFPVPASDVQQVPRQGPVYKLEPLGISGFPPPPGRLELGAVLRPFVPKFLRVKLPRVYLPGTREVVVSARCTTQDTAVG